jgi:hypothetical protein
VRDAEIDLGVFIIRRSFLIRSLLQIVFPIFLSTFAWGQEITGKWVYSVQQLSGVRELHRDSIANIFGKKTKVRLQFSCRPDKRGAIEVALVVADFKKLPEFHFQEFDEWGNPGPNDIDIAFTVRGNSFSDTFHDCPAGWPGELNGFHFPATGSTFDPASTPRKVINSILKGATEVEIIVSDKKHPAKVLRVLFPMANCEHHLKALIQGID